MKVNCPRLVIVEVIVATEPLPRPWYHGCVTSASVTPASLLLRPQAQFISPVNLGLLSLGSLSNRRILLLQAATHRLWANGRWKLPQEPKEVHAHWESKRAPNYRRFS